MNISVALLALAVCVLGQEHSTHPPNPNLRCHCFVGVHNIRLHAFLFRWHPFYDSECTDDSEKLCIEECVEHKDVLEAAGGWLARIPEHHHPGNMTLGDIACENLGRDESSGIFGQLYHALCERPTQWTGPALREPLCCDMGRHVRCHG